MQLLFQGRTEILFIAFLESYFSAFNISRKKELSVSRVSQCWKESVSFWFVQIIGLLFIPLLTGHKGFQLPTRMSSFVFFFFFCLFKRETLTVVLFYAPLKSSYKLLQPYELAFYHRSLSVPVRYFRYHSVLIFF